MESPSAEGFPDVQDDIRNSHGERLAYSWTGGDAGSRDVVVIGHGCTSDKDRPWSIALAQEFRRVGIASIRIAFAGNGDSDGRFEDADVTKGVADLGAVCDALANRRISYVGHSMGGAVGVVRAAVDPRIRALISLAAIAHTSAFVKRLFGHLRPGVDCMLEKPHCPLGTAFLADLDTIGSVTSHAGAITVPWLLVHGSDDEVVPSQDSLDMVAAAHDRHPPVHVELPGVDHSFSGTGIAPMTRTVIPWLVRVLHD